MTEPTKTLKTARILLHASYSVIPTKPESKEPALRSWKPYQEERADESLLSEWFRNGNGLGVVCGRISKNLMVMDFDAPGLWEEFAAACDANSITAYKEGALFRTPRGGNHLWLRCSAPVGGNKKLARALMQIPEGAIFAERNVTFAGKTYPWVETSQGRRAVQCVIETRGEGGYVLTYPSPGYSLLSTLRPDTIPTLSKDAVDALFAVAGLFDEYASFQASPGVSEQQETNPDRDHSPGADYNQRGDYEAVLEKHGWRRLHSWHNRTTWQRPGKVGTGISATTGFPGRMGYERRLYCFTTNGGVFENNRYYDPFGVFARLEFGGDFSAATRELARLGYGEPAKRPKGRPRKEAAETTVKEPSGEKGEDKESGWDELTLARAWSEEYRSAFVYVEGDQWYRYEAGRWIYTSAERVSRCIQEFLEKLLPSAKVTRSKVSNVQFHSARMVGPMDVTEFNAHPHLIPLRNGVYDTNTGELLPHSPDYYLTTQATYEYVEKADCPLWKRCLEEWLIDEASFPCPAWIELIQEWYGYCLIPDNTAQVSLFWLGEGGNGKGVAARALTHLIGPSATVNVPIDQLHDPYHRADIYGKLLGLVNEPDRRAMQKNGNWFKALTGGDDMISARRPGEKVFNFFPTCRIVVSCNEMPSTSDPSLAYFRRIIPIEWRYNVPAEKRDSGLDDKIALEMPGIFNWAMAGLSRLKERRKRFEIPEESLKLLDSYKKSQDSLLQFIEDQCASPKDSSAWISNEGFYKAYSGWCATYALRPIPASFVSTRMPKMGFESKARRIQGSLKRGWEGIAIKEEEETE